MAGTIGNKSDEIAIARQAIRLVRRQLFQQIANGFYHLDILPFIMAANIVSFARLTVRCYLIERPGVIFNKQPVADLLPVAINRQRFARQRIQDGQRDQFFREMIRPIVIRAVSDQRWQAVGPLPGANQMVAAGFRGRIGTAGRIGRCFGKKRAAVV